MRIFTLNSWVISKSPLVSIIDYEAMLVSVHRLHQIAMPRNNICKPRGACK